MTARRALVDFSNDPKQVERAQRIARERDRAYRMALTEIAYTPAGEVLFEMIAERAAFFVTSYEDDSHRTAFNEGRRSLGLQFLTDWTLARPDALAAMLAKRATEERKNDG
jgi:hypothetical protein